MADRLTQLQDCLDQLATQMFSALMYTTDRSNLAAIPGQPDMSNLENLGQSTQTGANQTTQNLQNPGNEDPNNQVDQSRPATDPPAVFNASLHELARDLILKEQQIEMIISKLPGIGTSEVEQTQKLKELEERLIKVEEERVEAVKEKEKLLDIVDEVILSIRRI